MLVAATLRRRPQEQLNLLMAGLDAFVAQPEFFRNSALNLTWSGSVPVWLTNLFRASHFPSCYNLRFVRIPGGHDWAIASAENTGDKE